MKQLWDLSRKNDVRLNTAGVQKRCPTERLLIRDDWLFLRWYDRIISDGPVAHYSHHSSAELAA